MESYSQCGQDLFVINLLNKDNGTFLDLGCYLPKKINNTYLLETKGWKGVSIDIIDYSNEWNCRTNPFLIILLIMVRCHMLLWLKII